MARKLISFLGAGVLHETTYSFSDYSYKTCYMAEASARFFRPEQVLIVVTPEAHNRHFAALCERLADVYTPQPLNIPTGRTEEELWQMFTVIADAIKADDIIYFDVTNAFRSLPLLTLLITSYVRIVRNAQVERIVYGAFEAKTPDNITPVFDLTPFIRLLDWTTATDALLKYGRADDLAQLVADFPQFAQLGTMLQGLTAALQTSRPAETLTQAHDVKQAIAIIDSVAATPVERPATLLLDHIAEEYSLLAHESPTAPERAREVVGKQLEIIDWYIRKRMFVQALTAAREWMVSLVLMHMGHSLFGKSSRKRAEEIIRGEGTHADVRRIPNLAAIQHVWGQTTAARNSVAHHGWSLVALTAQDIEAAARAVSQQLRTLL